MSSEAAVHRAFEALDADRGTATSLLQSMIRLQGQGERAVQDLVAAELGEVGARVERVSYDPRSVPLVAEFATAGHAAGEQRDSVVGTFEAGIAGGRSLILFAHPDAEPLRDNHGWSRDPFAGTIDDGRIYGWGVADDLAGVATMIAAMRAIRAAGIELAGDVIAASTPSKRHARGIAALLHHGYAADAAIYLHPAESGVGMREIKALASGELEFSITVQGRRPDTSEPGHTAFSHLAVNPLDKALSLIAALRELDAERSTRVSHPLLQAAVGRSTNLMISRMQFGGDEPRSRLPLQLTFGGAISFPPSETTESVRAEVGAALAGVVEADDWLAANPPELTWLSGVTGAEVSSDHELFRIVAGAVGDVCGFPPHVNAMHTSSDIRNPMVQKGIPTVGLGPLCGDLTHAGGTDEWVDVDDFHRAVKVAAASIINWCGVR